VRCDFELPLLCLFRVRSCVPFWHNAGGNNIWAVVRAWAIAALTPTIIWSTYGGSAWSLPAKAASPHLAALLARERHCRSPVCGMEEGRAATLIQAWYRGVLARRVAGGLRYVALLQVRCTS